MSKPLRYGTITVLISLAGLTLLASVMWLLPIKNTSTYAPASAALPGFIALGDWGEGDYRQRRVAALMETMCRRGGVDFIQTLGDNFYPDGVQSATDSFWQSHFEDIYDTPCLSTVPFHAALGNHDYGGLPDAQIDYSIKNPERWKMPGAWYVHREDLFTIVVIDTNQSIEVQRQFLRNELTNDTAPWRIVAGHHNIRTLSEKYQDDTKLRAELLSDLKELDVHFYLSGHSHNLQLLAMPQEPIYIVSGGGGKSPRPMAVNDTAPFLSEMNGFAQLQFTPDEVFISFTTTSGEFLTTFSSRTEHFGLARACLMQGNQPACVKQLSTLPPQPSTASVPALP